MFPIYKECPCGADESDADPRELLPDVDPPPTTPAPAHAARTELINEGGRCYLSTSP